nr:hypothetical protein [Actinomycetota bacterium]
LTSDVEVAGRQVEEATRRQTHLEGEISVADAKIGREEQRLFSGSVANPKELSALQSEVAMLKRKRGELEDSLLEAMVDRDQAEETAHKLAAEKSETETIVATLKETVASLVDDLDRQIASHEAKRMEIAATIPAKVGSEWLGSNKARVSAAIRSCRRGRSRGCGPKADCSAAITAGGSS